MLRLLSCGLLATLVGLCLAAAAQDAPPAAAARRLELLRAGEQGAAALPALRQGLMDENGVVRRTAVRLLADLGAPAREALLEAWKSGDAVVRQTALKALVRLEGADRDALLGQALADTDLTVRLVATSTLAALPRTAATQALLQTAAQDTSDAVRAIAGRALWPFRRAVVPLRERPDWDHEIAVVQTTPLPKDGWRFALDPRRDGHLSKWHEADFDDSAWQTIASEQTWEKAGYEFDGVAWYRRTVDLPGKPEGTINAVEIAFEAVDECAWVWVNGVYVGQHDLGTAGWDRAFTLDITDAVRWGAPNQITVRVLDTAFAGGIWKPVRIEALR